MIGWAKRLRKELQEVRQLSVEDEPDIFLRVHEDSLLEWRAWIRGPHDTPYADGVFELEIKVTTEYPLSPPTVRFATPVFHPNVHGVTGEVCVDILKSEWTPAWTLLAACRAVRAVLEHPNADSPLNCDAGNLIRRGALEEFEDLARTAVAEHALREIPSSGATPSPGSDKPRLRGKHQGSCFYWHYLLALSPIFGVLIMQAVSG
ncbi:hypothetical protein CTAYLR_009853 [Chrysophaeum taylorii]|uniref:UBC core domain-containing protein n=1 Tax=Chrysophaeum taylorii TaxID=2483200 RepID=A0AAD7U623_9STRA|nr:hypothetical protein CTAYLR_009853 [Chrysophaeum taylorii]